MNERKKERTNELTTERQILPKERNHDTHKAIPN